MEPDISLTDERMYKPLGVHMTEIRERINTMDRLLLCARDMGSFEPYDMHAVKETIMIAWGEWRNIEHLLCVMVEDIKGNVKPAEEADGEATEDEAE
jgi:hypothetical protein